MNEISKQLERQARPTDHAFGELSTLLRASGYTLGDGRSGDLRDANR